MPESWSEALRRAEQESVVWRLQHGMKEAVRRESPDGMTAEDRRNLEIMKAFWGRSDG